MVIVEISLKFTFCIEKKEMGGGGVNDVVNCKKLYFYFFHSL